LSPGAGALGVGAATGLLAAPRIVRAEGKITVLNWQGYGTDEKWAVENFKKATGIEVVHDYFNSEPEMITKLRTNPGAYDVVLTNSAWNGVASSEELVQAIDTSAIKHFADLNPSLRDSALLGKDGKVYGVSWVWGMTAIAYNTEKFNPAPDSGRGPVGPEERQARVGARRRGRGGVLWRDRDRPGHEPSEGHREGEGEAAGTEAADRHLWSSEDEWNKLFQSGTFDVSVYWSGSAARSKTNFKLPVGYMVPKEGGIGWFDGLAIASNAPEPQRRPRVHRLHGRPGLSTCSGRPTVGAPASANTKANEQLPADDVGRQIHGDQAAIKAPAVHGAAQRRGAPDLLRHVDRGEAEFAK
jgi:spermidine/putrescine transport system substrate-binding protein